jgi:hypothetical protein
MTSKESNRRLSAFHRPVFQRMKALFEPKVDSSNGRVHVMDVPCNLQRTYQMLCMHGEECTAIFSVLQVRQHQGLGERSCCESKAHLISSSPCSRICFFKMRKELAWLYHQVTLFYHMTWMFTSHFGPACITSTAQL